MRLDWNRRPLPSDARIITTLDTHTAGEPLRIVTGGLPEIPGATMLERRRWLREHADDLRRLLMWEPRGHYDMYGCILTPPVTPEADLGVIFLHNEGYSTMCGHGVIALVTALLETGAFEPRGTVVPINLDTPAGLVRATAYLEPSGAVRRVTFRNVPAFVLHRDLALDIPAFGRIAVDVAFGGAFYAILPAERLGLRVVPEQTRALVAAAGAITRTVNASASIAHPDEPDLGFLYGAILTGPPDAPEHHSRNICVFADAEVDRSPTGTGVSARLAQLALRGEIPDEHEIHIESILGRQSVFGGRIVAHTRVGPHDAIIPEVSGAAHITGRHEFILDPRDTLGRGFLLPVT